MTTKFKQLMVRMKYSTFLKLKDIVPALREESMSHYFERLAELLKTYSNFNIDG